MAELDEIFNPKPTTVKEYLKIVIQQNEDFKEQLKNLQVEVNVLKRDLEKRNHLADEREKRHRQVRWVVGILAAIAGAIGAAILETVLGRK